MQLVAAPLGSTSTISYGQSLAGWFRHAREVELRKKAGYVFMPAKKVAGLLSPATSGAWVVQVPVAGTPFDVHVHDDEPLSPEEEEELSVMGVTREVQSELF